MFINITPNTEGIFMINKQSVDKMTEMLALIKKFGELGDVEVETEASSEYRRRAWVVTKMLSKFTEHAAESDFYFMRSASAHETDKERERLYRIARQEDREFMKVLLEFDDHAVKFAEKSAGNNEKTEGQLVHEIELLTVQVSTATAYLLQLQAAVSEKASKKKIKDVDAFVARDVSVIGAVAKLDTFKVEFSAATAAAAARGLKVKLTKIRTVVTRIGPVEAPVLDVVKKAKKVIEAAEPKSTKKAKPALTVVAKPAAKAKPKVAKKAA